MCVMYVEMVLFGCEQTNNIMYVNLSEMCIVCVCMLSVAPFLWRRQIFSPRPRCCELATKLYWRIVVTDGTWREHMLTITFVCFAEVQFNCVIIFCGFLSHLGRKFL
jgi:hypothetical protein